MFDILAEAESLASESELLLDGFKGGDKAGWIVGSEQIPGIEAGEVLKSTEELIAPDCKEEHVSIDSDESGRLYATPYQWLQRSGGNERR